MSLRILRIEAIANRGISVLKFLRQQNGEVFRLGHDSYLDVHFIVASYVALI